ncbi:MAG: YihY/virulence factor BrkB family protein [Bacteroidetes bacterium]|nr:MAG: YihY/virulence factor BrkB family protein [Bacteroidota bacterium]
MTKLERIIVKSPPIAFLVRKSKATVFPGFHGIYLYDVVKFLMQQIRKEGLNVRAAAISFNLLMALPPLLIFLFTLIPYFPFHKEFSREIIRVTKDLTPNQTTFIWVRDFIDGFTRPRGGLLSFGFILAVIFSSNAMIGVMRSFDRSLHIMNRQKRNFFNFRWTAIRLTSIIVMLFIASLLILITQKTLVRFVHIENKTLAWFLSSLRWLVIIALFYYGIGFIYRYAPAVEKKWKIGSPGTTLATTMMVLVFIIFSFWVNNFGNYNKVYGSIGTVLILMSTIFLNSLILLVGFELNVSINYLRTQAELRQVKEEKLA